MFDVGFWEISLIAVICLLVVGPERLPKLARTLGAYVGKARRVVADVKAEVDRELKADEFRNSAGGEVLKEIKDAAREARSVGQRLKSDLDKTIAVESDSAAAEPESEKPGVPAPQVEDTGNAAASPVESTPQVPHRTGADD